MADSALLRVPRFTWPLAAAIERQRPLNAPSVRRSFRRLLGESEHWTSEKIDAYQWLQLRRVLRHAYESVPYYRAVFASVGATPEDLQTATDLARLPLLTKEDLQEQSERL